MSELHIKPIIIVLFLSAILFVIGVGIFAFSAHNFNIVTLSVLGGGYIIYKTIKLKRETLKVEDNGFTYNGLFIQYSDIISISRLKEEKHLTKNYKIYLLGNSSIYFIKTQNQNIQLLGKLFSNTDKCMAELAKNAAIDIISM